MNLVYVERRQAQIADVEAKVTNWLAKWSLPLLRMSLGLIFLGFGFLKFFPGVSPAEELAQDTMSKLTLGLMPRDIGLLLVASLESTIGVIFLTGRYLKVGVGLLGMALVGILSPLVFFPGTLFSGEYNAPTIEGQYVMKDIILAAAALVVAVSAQGGRLIAPDSEGSDRADSGRS